MKNNAQKEEEDLRSIKSGRSIKSRRNRTSKYECRDLQNTIKNDRRNEPKHKDSSKSFLGIKNDDYDMMSNTSMISRKRKYQDSCKSFKEIKNNERNEDSDLMTIKGSGSRTSRSYQSRDSQNIRTSDKLNEPKYNSSKSFQEIKNTLERDGIEQRREKSNRSGRDVDRDFLTIGQKEQINSKSDTSQYSHEVRNKETTKESENKRRRRNLFGGAVVSLVILIIILAVTLTQTGSKKIKIATAGKRVGEEETDSPKTDKTTTIETKSTIDGRLDGTMTPSISSSNSLVTLLYSPFSTVIYAHTSSKPSISSSARGTTGKTTTSPTATRITSTIPISLTTQRKSSKRSMTIFATSTSKTTSPTTPTLTTSTTPTTTTTTSTTTTSTTTSTTTTSTTTSSTTSTTTSTSTSATTTQPPNEMTCDFEKDNCDMGAFRTGGGGFTVPELRTAISVIKSKHGINLIKSDSDRKTYGDYVFLIGRLTYTKNVPNIEFTSVDDQKLLKGHCLSFAIYIITADDGVPIKAQIKIPGRQYKTLIDTQITQKNEWLNIDNAVPVTTEDLTENRKFSLRIEMKLYDENGYIFLDNFLYAPCDSVLRENRPVHISAVVNSQSRVFVNVFVLVNIGAMVSLSLADFVAI